MTEYTDGTFDQDAMVARIAAESAAEHADEGENLKLVRDTFFERITDALAAGLIDVPDLVDVWKQRLWDQQSEKARGATRRLLDDFASGQMAAWERADVDSVQDVMVAAGKNRRTTFALFNEDDAFRVLDETLRNQADVNAAAARTNDMVMRLLPYLRRHGSIGAAIAAGDMPEDLAA